MEIKAISTVAYQIIYHLILFSLILVSGNLISLIQIGVRLCITAQPNMWCVPKQRKATVQENIFCCKDFQKHLNNQKIYQIIK